VNSNSGTIPLVWETYGATPPDGNYQYYPGAGRVSATPTICDAAARPARVAAAT